MQYDVKNNPHVLGILEKDNPFQVDEFITVGSKKYCYKCDELDDPMVNDYHILAMGYATEEELETIKNYALRINEILTDYLKDLNIELIDFKLEFGKTADGQIVLADEISPDTCRLWDKDTGEKLDKDRFRRDLGGVEDAYQEVMRRLTGK